MQAVSYSLWAIPDEPLFQKFSSIIFYFSKKFNSPLFEPHITILGGFEGNEKGLIEKTVIFANSHFPYTGRFLGVETGNEYFKRLFLKVAKDRIIKEAHRQAVNIFNPSNKSAYGPHLSLVYDDSSLVLINQAREGYLRQYDFSGMPFSVNKVALWCTQGTVDQWSKIVEFRLKSKNS